MDKKIAFTIIGIIIILIGGGLWLKQAGFLSGSDVEPIQIPEGIILFYGDGCPHCKNVDDFIAENNIEEKVSFFRFEVWYNKNNQNILAQVTQKCGISANQVGVPFLYDPPRPSPRFGEAGGEAGGEKCLMGEIDVIDFFKEKAGINTD